MFQRVVALAFLTACTAGETDVAPPQFNFYYPTAVKVSPSEKHLFVLSANSDLRYSTGTLATLDLDAVDALATTWLGGTNPGEGCTPTDRPQVIQCPTTDDNNAARGIILPRGTVKVGNFGVDIGVQRLFDGEQPTTKLRIFTTIRGDPSITWIDFDETDGEMDCGPVGDAYPRCSPEHRLTRLRGDANLPAIPPEPFYIYVDGDRENVLTPHLTSGAVTLADAPRQVGSTPLIHDVNQNFWAPVGALGLVGAVGIAARTPGTPDGLIYVSSRQEARVAVLRIASGQDQPVGLSCAASDCPAAYTCDPGDHLCHKTDGRPWKALSQVTSFFLDGIPGGGFGADARALAFSADGSRLYMVSRTPAALKVFDTTLDDTGEPRNALLGVMDICDQPATLELADFGRGPRIVIPCFGNGQVWTIDPIALTIESTEDVGRGPTSVSVSPSRKRIYVANYAEDTIGVIDATPGARTEARMVLRIGVPRPTE